MEPDERHDGEIITTHAGRRAEENPGSRKKNDASSGTGASCSCNNGSSPPCGVDRSGSGSGRTSTENRKDDDGISFQGKMVPKGRSPRRSRNGGSHHQPPAEKLMHDAIRGRNHGERRSSGYDEASGSSQRAGDTSSLLVRAAATEEEKAACHDFKFGDNQVSDALLAHLSELGASAPWLVDTKRLQSTDVRANQNRLQLPGRSPLSQAFTGAEKAGLRTPDGMSVAAFDRRGHEYDMTCKLWKGDKHYRFMGQGWKRFREAHHLTIASKSRLTRRVTAELWAFRSRALLPPPKGMDDGEAEEFSHPDGALGLVVLLRDDGEQGQEQVAEEVAPAESYVSRFEMLVAALALVTLRTRGETKRKRDED
ncbi:hypothetical protein BAE44_0018955 [Dichanthelium oligosanthes]|uniref:TF-B3 domain-containing protein n=1 Tax=Dichanthelium oligosanthes TaxID=888268 RepID=A0A1E5V4J7_9POAL|nr:hypothetical protein BAE44_0018955 [Dichanthelium oligosanthes]